MNQRFSKVIYQARKDKGYSQSKLAKLMGVAPSYISKLEHENINSPPSGKVIESLAHHLELDDFDLKRLAYRDRKISNKLLKKYKRMMSLLLRHMWNNPEFAQEVFEKLMEDFVGQNSE